MEFISENLDVIVTALLMLIPVIVGNKKWGKWKKSAGQALKISSSGLGLLNHVLRAIEDSRLTNEEIQQIKERATEVGSEFDDLMNKDGQAVEKAKRG